MPAEKEGMSKYGVDEGAGEAKTAAAKDGKCPQCGSVLESTTKTNVLKCPRCGTRPFESKK